MDLAERLNVLTEQNNAPLPEQKHYYSDAEAKAVFLSALEEGKTIPEAAKEAGRTASWFRRRRNPSAHWTVYDTGRTASWFRRRRNPSAHWTVYDKDFSMMFEEIVGEGGPWRESICLRMLTAMVNAAESGSVRAQEKILATYSRDFAWLRPAMVNGSVNVEQLQVFFSEMPLDKLRELKTAREKSRKELPPVIDQ